MIGTQKVTLTSESIKEAIAEYLNRHLHAQVQVKTWAQTPNNYGGPATIDVEFDELDKNGPSA